MATSGSFQTSPKRTSRGMYFTFNWWVSHWSGNTATISWEIWCRSDGGTSGSTWSANYGFSYGVNGGEWSNGSNFVKDSFHITGSFTKGGGQSFSAWINSGITSAADYSNGSGSWTLDNNVITPTVSVSVGARTETSIAVSMTVTNNGNAGIVDNYIDIFNDSGCTSKAGGISGTSGTVSGLTANKTYYVRANASNGTYRGYSGVATTSTYQYPYITGITTSALTIGSAQTISLYNPLKRSVDVYMKKDNTSGTTLFSKASATTGTSYSFTPTASTLYAQIPAATSGNCCYYVQYSGKNIANKTGTFKVKGNNAEAPTFSSFNVTNSNTTATGLTGNANIFIDGMSSCKFTIPAANKATSGFSATLDHYNFAWPNGAGQSATYSTSDVTATVTNGNTTSVSVTAYDKRGQYKTVTKSITLIRPYHANSQSMGSVRANGINTEVSLTGKFTYWCGDWANGTARPNNLNKVEYRVNKTGSYYDITTAVKNGSTSSKSGQNMDVTLKASAVKIHANGSSGGFPIGKVATVEIFVTTGPTTSVSYDNRQKIAEITITSGTFGLSRYKDTSNNYHYAISGLPESTYALKVYGNLATTTALYVGGIKAIWYA